MLGLQLISPTVDSRCVTSSVRALTRADAAAASDPAWPPPATTTSKGGSEGDAQGRHTLVQCGASGSVQGRGAVEGAVGIMEESHQPVVI